MRIPGRRRCLDCGTEWSYFDTGEIECPACGSLRSRGLDEARALHTDSPVDLDLSTAREMIDQRPVRAVATAAANAARGYLVRRGFIDGGDLRPLDDAFIRAAELRHVANELRHRLEPDEAAERYFLALLAEDGDPPGTVPAALRSAHGLAAAGATDAYVADLRRWLDEHPDPVARDRLERLRNQVRRVNALNGDIAPDEADRLLEATRSLGEALRTGDDEAYDLVDERLDRLE